jgi:hypothetical protein
VVLDAPAGQPPRLFVDANGNGDFSDDPAVAWTWKEYQAKDKDGKPIRESAVYEGSAMVQVAYGAQVEPLHIVIYTPDQKLEQKDPRAQRLLKNILWYYADYAREGNIFLGDKPYKALLRDRLAKGDFRGKPGAILIHGQPISGVELFVDVDGNGRFNLHTEVFDVLRPFEVNGTTYEVTGLTASGDSFQIVATGKKEPEGKRE